MARKKRGRQISGIIVLDKAQGETSNGALQQVKRLLNAAKAGHTGSLDPLATGVLPLCFGEATKVSQYLLDSDKVYSAKVKFGVKTDTGDSEGQVVSTASTDDLSPARLEHALQDFRGDIEQVPSMYSAIKHEGVPLYKLARQGKSVERKKRVVTISRLDLMGYADGEAELEIHCTKGTYIRTLADDLGDRLGVGGHVIALKRLKAGPFTLEQSVTYGHLAAQYESGGSEALDSFLIPADVAVGELPAVVLPPATAFYVKQGQPVIIRHLPTSGMVRLYEEQNFIGIGVILADGRVAPKRLMLGQGTPD